VSWDSPSTLRVSTTITVAFGVDADFNHRIADQMSNSRRTNAPS
jgi:hypothetical protein